MSLLQILSIVPLLLVAAGGPQQSDVRDFPGATTDLISPRGDKRLLWDEPQEDRHEHRLSLVDVKTGISITALLFSRSVSVSWAPNGTAFAVTNRASSDGAQCLLFVIGTAALPARRNLSTQLRASGLAPAQVWTNHHVYCEVLEWHDGDVLSLRLRGYGDADPQGFEHRYDYSLKSGFETPQRARRVDACGSDAPEVQNTSRTPHDTPGLPARLRDVQMTSTTLVLKLCIDEAGKVARIVPLRSTGNGTVDEFYAESMASWTFTPERRAGNAIKSVTFVTVTIDVQPDDEDLELVSRVSDQPDRR